MSPDHPIDHKGCKYRTMAAELEADILSGRYAIGDRLLSERRLASTHGVTVMTARGALKVLSDKGLISREQGRGTFVRASEPPLPSPDVSSLPVGLLGFGAAHSGGSQAINWQLSLRRLRGIVDAGAQLGLAAQTLDDPDPSWTPSRLLKHLERFSGLILHQPCLPVALLPLLFEQGLPVVAINCYLDADYCCRIHVNSRLGAFTAVRHLARLGHERIGLIVGDEQRLSMRERLLGYRDALAASNLTPDNTLIALEPRGWPQDAGLAARRLLHIQNPPTAIFAASDYRALGVLEHLNQAGRKIPEEIAVMGFDDIHEAAQSRPPLSTVYNPLYESGRLAARLLHAQLRRGRPDPQLHVMKCRLQIRATCGAQPSDNPAPRNPS